MSDRRIGRRPIILDRTRSIGSSGFSYVPNRFLHDGFFASLGADELLLYFLLVLAGDRNGLSFYHYDSICALLEMPLERYVTARNGLIAKDLLAFDGSRFQVLSLPSQAQPENHRSVRTKEEMEASDSATIRLLLQRNLQLD